LEKAIGAFTEIMSRDFTAAALMGTDGLMANVRGELHERLDGILDLMQKHGAEIRKGFGK
jgi:hypothetical protein